MKDVEMNWNQTPKGKMYKRAYDVANAERVAARKRAYRIANRDKIAAYQKAYCAANAERIARQQKVYHTTNKERIVESHKAWKDANAQRIAIYQKQYTAAYRAANTERIAALKEAYYVANRDREAEKRRKWRAANPEKRALHHARRKARLRGAHGSHTLQEWQEKCAEFNRCCAYCGEAKKLTRDHVIPISRGGSDHIENIVPACVSCNSKKRTRLPEEFTNHIRTGGVGGRDVETDR